MAGMAAGRYRMSDTGTDERRFLYHVLCDRRILFFDLIVFAAFTVLSIFSVRPIALKYLHQGADSRPSNADALIGREGEVTDTIEAGGYGRVKIDGDSWKAKSVDGMEIRRGLVVRVLRLESIIATVERC